MRTQLFILQISCLPIKIPTCEPKGIWLIKNYIMMLYMLAATRVGLFQGSSQREELTVLVPECHLNCFKLLSLKWHVFSYVMRLSEFSTCNIVTCMLAFCFSWDALEFVLHLLPSFVVAAMSPRIPCLARFPSSSGSFWSINSKRPHRAGHSVFFQNRSGFSVLENFGYVDIRNWSVYIKKENR